MTCPRHREVNDQTRVAALGVLNQILKRPGLARLIPIVAWGLEPCKELTEAYAITRAALDWARTKPLDRRDASVRVLVVGDGRSPRAGSMLAAQTAWQITSLDPAMRVEGVEGLPHLRCVRGYLRHDGTWMGFDMVLAPHSHAPIDATRAAVRVGGAVIALPCCIEWPAADAQHHYHDNTILSPERRVVMERRVQ